MTAKDKVDMLYRSYVLVRNVQVSEDLKRVKSFVISYNKALSRPTL